MNPWIIIAALVAIAIAGLGGYHHGRQVEQGEAAQAALESERLTAAIVKHQQVRVDDLAARLASAKAKVIVKDREIIKEVVRYETLVPAARRVELDGAWRLLHDAAATGEPADTTGLTAGRAAPVKDAAALETVAINYEQCRDWRASLIGWQEWWQIVRNTGRQPGGPRPADPD